MTLGRRAALVAALAAMATTPGCRALERLFNPDAPKKSSVRTAWLVPETGFSHAQPAFANGLVFVGDGSGRVVAHDQATGQVRWSSRVANDAFWGANFLASGGIVVAPVLRETVGVDAATGQVRWRYQAPPDTVGGGDPGGGPVPQCHIDTDGQTVYIPAWGGTVSALDLATGAVRWIWSANSTVAGRAGAQGVRVSGGRVYVSVWHFLNGTGTRAEAWVVALDAGTGHEIWRRVLPSISNGVANAGRPELAAGRVITMLKSGEVYALDAATGNILWHVPQEIPGHNEVFNVVFAGPAVAGDVIYADGGISDLRALRVADGSLVWRVPYSGELKQDLIVTDRYIYGTTEELTVFDRGSGRNRGFLIPPGKSLEGAFFTATPGLQGHRLFAPLENGFWAFDER